MHRFLGLLFLAALPLPAGRAVELYSTDFSNFTDGPDRIAGAPASGTTPAIPATDGWTGSPTGQDRSGILAEADHAYTGVGNAAYLGGNPATLSGSTMNVRKTFNYAPVSAGNEVVTIRVLAGIKDSTAVTRDKFEFLIYNNNTLGGVTPAGAYPLAGIQFDNSTINVQTGKPGQTVNRYASDASGNLTVVSTGVTFVYDALEELELRINFRTNLWSATLDTIPLFSDVVFYSGPHAKNLGSLLVQCRATISFSPGTNYMLFDDLSVNADPLPVKPEPPEITFSAATGARLTWYQEAGYRYEVKYSDVLGSWKTGLPGAISTAAATGFTGALTDASATGVQRRFYQVTRITP